MKNLTLHNACLMNGKDFGKRIQALRKKSGLSQELLAERAEIAHRALQTIESGQGNPTLETISALANALNMGAADLFADELAYQGELFLEVVRLLTSMDKDQLSAVLFVARGAGSSPINKTRAK
jgi:transcriptional regulator with XRE-family HTH domain